MKRWIMVALAITLLVVVSLTITMAGAAPDVAPAVKKPAAVATADETETVDEADDTAETASFPKIWPAMKSADPNAIIKNMALSTAAPITPETNTARAIPLRLSGV